jgi:UDP-hydrolysing UDP-N-acetyl-D-glucosamine 2-epimerase
MKILALTGNRSDYDLLSPLYRLLHKDPQIELKLVVSGGHLAKNYGYSVQAIKEDGYSILCEIESLIQSDSKQSRLKSVSLVLQSSIDMVAHFDPDLILYVGDREEVIVGGLLGCYLEKPTMHFWSGDHASDGNTDNAIRHATSKLSSIHMVSLPQHRERLIKMGESPERIFYVGSIALDNFKQHMPIAPSLIKKTLNAPSSFDNEYALVIYHPLPAERALYAESLKHILDALLEQKIPAFINAPNTDPGNHLGLALLERYKDHPNFIYTKNLARDVFLSIYKNAKFIIGNSSSGIVEAASIPIPAINVGERQKGRFAESNVLFCGLQQEDIRLAIQKACSDDFLRSIKSIKNPYGDGQSAQRAYDIIKHVKLQQFVYKNEDPLILSNKSMEVTYE